MKKVFTLLVLLCVFLFSNAQGTWTQKASFGGTQRLYACGFSIGSKGYIGTGKDASGPTQDFWEWDQATDTWTQKANFPGTACAEAVCFSIGTKGYIGTGGNGTPPGGPMYSDFWEWDQTNNTWTQKTDFAGSGRFLATGFSIGTKGYIGTGYDGSFKSDFWEWDQTTDSWTQKASFGGAARWNACGFSIGTKGYIGGGYATNFAVQDFWEWDQTNNTWTQKADIGGAVRSGPVGFSMGGKGYIGTGAHDPGPVCLNDFWEYNPANDSWTQIANLSGNARGAAIGFSIGSKGYVGTGVGTSGTYYNDFWEWSNCPVNAIVSTGSVTCNGGNDGSASVASSGGTPPYTYLWSTGETTSAITGLSAVTYTLVSTDAAATCSVTTFVNVGGPAAIAASFSTTPTACSGSTGTATANPSGGTSPYTYLWDANAANQTTQTATGLTTGNYSLIITDAHSCTGTAIVSVTNVNNLYDSISTQTNVTCYGGNNGLATVTVSGGNSPFTYNWNNGQTTSTATGLSIGSYSITVTDNNSCTAAATVNITQPAAITVSVTPSNATCDNSGTALVNISNGSNPFSYLWSNGETVSADTNLSAGSYSLTVTDSSGCIGTSTFSISNNVPAAPSICLVTVDSLSKYNVIVWDKTPFAGKAIDSFIVYRELNSNNYQPIGTVPFDSLSLFVDTVRAKYFPFSGDPNSGTYRYKLGVRDTCGDFSLLSPYHNTIFATNNNGTFSWIQLYTIENASNPVSSYILMRDDNSTGNWHAVNAVSGTQQSVTDPAYSTYQSTATWRVQTQWNISCTPTIINPKNPEAFSTALNSSLSNAYSLNNPTAVNATDINNQVIIFPNPNNGIFTLKNITSDVHSIEIYNVFGELVYSSSVNVNHQIANEVDLNEVSNGVYFLQLKTLKGTIMKKIVVSK